MAVKLNLSDKILDHLLEVMEENKITPNQLFLGVLLKKRDLPTIRKIHLASGETFVKFMDVEHLLNLEYAINNGNDKEVLELKNIYITSEMFDILQDKFYVYADEFVNAYPSFLDIDNRRVTSKAVNIEKEVKNKYKDYMQGKVENHYKLMEYLAKLKIVNNNKAPMGIVKFLESKIWESDDLKHVGDSEDEI